MYVAPKVANKFVKMFDQRTEEEQQLMLKALRSAKTAAQLFKNLQLPYKLDMEK